MKKKTFAIGALVFITLVAGFVAATTEYTLLIPEYGVAIQEGAPLDLPEGTVIGGVPPGDYVTLDEEREFETTNGPVILEEGEPIWCEDESAPGYPDVCSGIS